MCLIYDALRVWLLLTDVELFVCCYYLVSVGCFVLGVGLGGAGCLCLPVGGLALVVCCAAFGLIGWFIYMFCDCLVTRMCGVLC